MVPSLPLLLVCPVIVRPGKAMFGRPAMPSALLVGALAAWLARIVCRGCSRSARRRTSASECGRSRCCSPPACEVRLREAAAGRVAAAGDGEERVHTAVRRAVGVCDEAHLAHRPVRRDERRHAVRSRRACWRTRPAGSRRDSIRRSRAANGSRRSCRGSSRPETLGDGFLLGEVFQAGFEVLELMVGQPRQRRARCRRRRASVPDRRR